MIVKRLQLTNFMNVSFCDLNFSTGINVISGPTGNGKSAIFAAQAFCLAGSKRGDSWKDFIKIGSDKMIIDMDLERFENDDIMNFHIEGSSSSSSMVREIRYKDQFYRNSDCDTFIEKYFDSDMMENILFHLQDSSAIVNITPSKRRELLKKIFNSDFSSIVEIIKNDSQKYKDDIKTNKTKLGVLNSLTFELKDIETIIPINLDLINKEIEENKKYISDINNLINSNKLKLAQIQSNLSSILSEINDNKKNSMVFTNLLNDAKTSLEGIFINLSEKTLLDNKEILIKLSEEKVLLEKEKEKLTNNYNNLYSENKKIQERFTQCSTKVMILENQLKVFDTNSICPTCGQSCSIEHKEKLELEINTLNLELNKEKELLEKSTKDLKDVNDLLIKTNTLYNIAITKYQTTTVNINHLELKIEEDKKFLEQYNNYINEYTIKLQELDNLKIQLEEKLNKESNEDIKEKLNNEINEYNKLIIEKERDNNNRLQQIKDYEIRIKINEEKEKFNKEIKEKEIKTKEEINTLEKEISEIEKNIIDLDFIKTVFDSELPNHIMVRACSFLEKGINSFLSSSKDDFQVKLIQNTKGIDFFYKARNEPDWIKAKMASGFETNLLTIAFKFTIALAYDTKYIIFDEPDKSADEISSIKLMETITKINGFDQIFITTHRPRALDYLKELGAKIYLVDNGEYTAY